MHNYNKFTLYIQEKEEEEKLERRLFEQQEKMRREFEEEMARKRAKEEAVNTFLNEGGFASC